MPPGGSQRGADGRVELLRDLDRPRSWMLLVDGAPQSHVDLDDPRHLEFEYMRRLGHVIDLAAPAGTPLRVLHLGGGGLTLARYVAATRPGSSQLAVESDAEVAELVRRRLPLGRPLAHARGRVAAVRAVFQHACVIAEAAVLRGRRFGNLVVAGSDQELPIAGLIRRAAADPFPARLVEGDALTRVIAGTAPVTAARAEPSPVPPPGAFA